MSSLKNKMGNMYLSCFRIGLKKINTKYVQNNGIKVVVE